MRQNLPYAAVVVQRIDDKGFIAILIGMSSRRRSRRKSLSEEQAADLVRRALDLRIGMIATNIQLDPYSAQYQAISGALDQIHVMLEAVAVVEADASAFLDLMDRILIGPFIAIVNELSGIVPQRAALVGMLYMVARRMRGDSLTGQEAGRQLLGRVNASEIGKGRPAYTADRRHRSIDKKVEIGRDLLAKKASLPRGRFGPWLEASGLSIAVARACMRVPRAAGEDVEKAA